MAAIISRLSTPVVQATSRRAFSTSAAARANTTTAPTSTSSGWWSNLQPQTKRYVVYGVATCAAVDSYVMYNYYPRWFGSSEESKQ